MPFANRPSFLLFDDYLTREVLHRAKALAAGLQRLGLNVGDRVGVWLANRWEWVVSIYLFYPSLSIHIILFYLFSSIIYHVGSIYLSLLS